MSESELKPLPPVPEPPPPLPPPYDSGPLTITRGPDYSPVEFNPNGSHPFGSILGTDSSDRLPPF